MTPAFVGEQPRNAAIILLHLQFLDLGLGCFQRFGSIRSASAPNSLDDGWLDISFYIVVETFRFAELKTRTKETMMEYL